MNNQQALILFSDSSRGVYIPKHFADSIDRDLVQGIDLKDLDFLSDNDPYDAEDYWDVWEYIIDNCTIKNADNVYHLWQDGDLWLYCENLMTEQEKQQFFEVC